MDAYYHILFININGIDKINKFVIKNVVYSISGQIFAYPIIASDYFHYECNEIIKLLDKKHEYDSTFIETNLLHIVVRFHLLHFSQ